MFTSETQSSHSYSRERFYYFSFTWYVKQTQKLMLNFIPCALSTSVHTYYCQLQGPKVVEGSGPKNAELKGSIPQKKGKANVFRALRFAGKQYKGSKQQNNGATGTTPKTIRAPAPPQPPFFGLCSFTVNLFGRISHKLSPVLKHWQFANLCKLATPSSQDFLDLCWLGSSSFEPKFAHWPTLVLIVWTMDTFTLLPSVWLRVQNLSCWEQSCLEKDCPTEALKRTRQYRMALIKVLGDSSTLS